MKMLIIIYLIIGLFFAGVNLFMFLVLRKEIIERKGKLTLKNYCRFAANIATVPLLWPIKLIKVVLDFGKGMRTLLDSGAITITEKPKFTGESTTSTATYKDTKQEALDEDIKLHIKHKKKLPN